MFKLCGLSIRLTAIALCICLTQFSYAKKGSLARTTAPASTVTVEDVEQQITATEAEVVRLGAKLDQLRQDSSNTAGDFQVKMSAFSGKNSPVESQLVLKTQDLAALRSQRDKARQDSLAAATKQNERALASKKESTRIETLLMATSNQLNVLTNKRQALPSSDALGDSKAVIALQKEISRTDSLIRTKQNDLGTFSKKRDQLRQDSLLQESESAEIRKRSFTEGKRIDSLLVSLTQNSSDNSGKQSKTRDNAVSSLAQEQAKLSDLTRQKAIAEAQIARLKMEMAAITGERERLKTLSGSSQKKNEYARTPLANAFASVDEEFIGRVADKEALKMLMEKVILDSAISKAKNNLDAAIEQRARGKRGAEKLVDQREGEVTTLMGQLDDVVRKQPKVAQYELQIAGLTSTELKRKHVETMIGQAQVDMATCSVKRDQAKAALDDFDKTHQPTANPSALRLAQLDSSSSVKEKSIMSFGARRDSLSEQITLSQRTLESLTLASKAESAKADSGATMVRKQKTELMVMRAQLRADSMKNESSGMVAVLKVKTEQAKLNAQYAMLDRDVTTLNATKEKLKQAIVETQNREKMSKLTSLQERKKLDSLIAAKEQEVTALSLQNEKASQENQNSAKETELTLQKQIAALAMLGGQIISKTQEIAALNQQVDAAKKLKASVEKTGLEKIHLVEQDKQATVTSLESKKTEVVALKRQKEDIERSAAKLREEQELAAKRLHEEQEREAKRLHDSQERALKREIARFDSLVTITTQRIATLETKRDKARQDSIGTETLKAESVAKSISALRRHDSLTLARQQQVADLNEQIEKARQDSSSKNVPIVSSASLLVKSVDSLISLKEKELLELRKQREKAHQDILEDQRKQATIMAASRQAIAQYRTQMFQKKAELLLSQTERKHLQLDSANALARASAASQVSALEIAQENGQLEKKKTDLAALQAQRDEASAKAASLGVTAPVAAIAIPTSSASNNASAATTSDLAQKQVEEIYMFIGTNKLEDAINRFNNQKINLSKNINPEAFRVLKNTIDQLSETVKKTPSKKR